MADFKRRIFLIFKFVSYWSEVKNKDRKKYEEGHKKSINLERDVLSLLVDRWDWKDLLLAMRHDFEWYYNICGASP